MEDDEKEMSVCDSEFAFYKKTTVAICSDVSISCLLPMRPGPMIKKGPLHILWCDVMMYCDDRAGRIFASASCRHVFIIAHSTSQATVIRETRDERQPIAEHNHSILSLYTVTLYYLYVEHWTTLMVNIYWKWEILILIFTRFLHQYHGENPTDFTIRNSNNRWRLQQSIFVLLIVFPYLAEATRIHSRTKTCTICVHEHEGGIK
jgi:hypothetical protein